MINLIGTDIKNELLVVYTLIGLVVAFLIVFLIIDHVKNKNYNNKNNTKGRSLKELEKEAKQIDSFEEQTIKEKSDDIIIPIENVHIDEGLLNELDNEDIYVENELEKTQAQIEVEEITKALEAAKQEERIDPYKKFEEEQEQNAIISYEELQEQFDKLYDENEKIQYVNDNDLPINIEELYQKNEEILNPKKVKLDDLKTIKIKSEIKDKISTPNSTGFKSSPVISPVYGIQSSQNQNITKTEVNDIDVEIKKTNEFLKTLKELQKNLD